MLRIALLVIIMAIVSHLPDSAGGLLSYKDYVLAGLLTVMLKPWLVNRLD